MSQIHGSGIGNYTNTAVVDNSVGSRQGRLLVTPAEIMIPGYKEFAESLKK